MVIRLHNSDEGFDDSNDPMKKYGDGDFEFETEDKGSYTVGLGKIATVLLFIIGYSHTPQFKYTENILREIVPKKPVVENGVSSINGVVSGYSYDNVPVRGRDGRNIFTYTTVELESEGREHSFVLPEKKFFDIGDSVMFNYNVLVNKVYTTDRLVHNYSNLVPLGKERFKADGIVVK
jgi:hypothetical protein